MLTISSISVSPWPQQTPVVKAQPVSATKTSNAVSKDSAGVGVPGLGGTDGAQAQAAYAPSAVPPVDPAAESAPLELPANTAVPQAADKVVQTALAQRDAVKGLDSSAAPKADAAVQDVVPAPQSTPAQLARFKGELPPATQYPEQKALETQINDLVPNLWKASGAAVEVLIGDDARAAAAARAKVLDKMTAPAADTGTPDAAAQVADTYAAQSGMNTGQAPGSVLSENA